ncbi:nuclear transport factor 2 family protein [Planotetraspora sp. A-T 1434]|uniref:ester cyclase n=1 Tax=Planotetraspora sp. A-T 1434 TaxID=2979219 RepID=UPI0021C23124|nr:nuclear transport factor 2 family protein [Planotetraspora sp. A-T 1434]MCT9933107.1 nuclear transport factor 2 family protein [Planotetraspora sp. A-T 1434]
MSDAEKIVDQAIRTLNDHDLDGTMRWFSRDVVRVGPAGQAEGHEEVASYYALFLDAFPDARVTVWSTYAFGDIVVVEGMCTGTHRGPLLLPGGEVLEPTGRGVSVRMCAAFTVENGLIVSCRNYFDQLELFARLGVGLAVNPAP